MTGGTRLALPDQAVTVRPLRRTAALAAGCVVATTRSALTGSPFRRSARAVSDNHNAEVGAAGRLGPGSVAVLQVHTAPVDPGVYGRDDAPGKQRPQPLTRVVFGAPGPAS